MARNPARTGDRLFLTLKVPGYGLDGDGSLTEALDQGTKLEAWVVLSGEVKECRGFQEKGYLLRLTGLIRVLD
jgi:hypothetical protein